jgi:hypothetical protein
VHPRTVFRVVAVTAILTVLAGLLAAPSSAAPAGQASGRYLVRARSAADLGGLRARAVADGARVVRTIPQINAMVVRASAAAKGRLAADRRAAGVATDRLTSPDTVDRAKPDLSAPGCAAPSGCGPAPRPPPGRPGSTPTRPGTTRACSGTTAAWACPRAGARRPAAPR